MKNSKLKKASLVLIFIFTYLSLPNVICALNWQIESVDKRSTYASLVIDSDDYPRIGYGNIYSRLDEERWQIDTIQEDSASIVDFEGTSLALDSSQSPHAFYFVEAGYPQSVVYAYHNGAQWILDQQELSYNYTTFYSSLAIDGSGRPHISHPNNYGVDYRYHDGSAWQVTRIASPGGGHPSELKLDSQQRRDRRNDRQGVVHARIPAEADRSGGRHARPVRPRHREESGPRTGIFQAAVAGGARPTGKRRCHARRARFHQHPHLFGREPFPPPRIP